MSCDFMGEVPYGNLPPCQVWGPKVLDSGDMVLDCHVTLQDLMKTGSCDFMVGDHQVNLLPYQVWWLRYSNSGDIMDFFVTRSWKTTWSKCYMTLWVGVSVILDISWFSFVTWPCKITWWKRLKTLWVDAPQGILLDDRLNIDDHINNICRSAANQLNVLIR